MININDQLSFFVLDARRNRERGAGKFATDADFDGLRTWLENLKSPGVIVTSQLLFDMPKGIEKNLTDFNQYKDLCRIISDSQHDIIYLTGDVHFGRVAEVNLKSGRRLFEIVASPMSLVENGSSNFNYSEVFARGLWELTVDTDPVMWPHVQDPTYPGQPITYHRATPENENDQGRSHENFVTLRFTLGDDKKLKADVVSWLPRVLEANGKPRQGFTFTINSLR